MNKETLKDKRFKLSIGISIILCINLFIFMYFSVKQSGFSGLTASDWTIFTTLIILAVAAPLSIKFRFNPFVQKHEQHSLSPQFDLVYQDIQDYIKHSRIPKRDKREILSDIYDILSEGYADNRSIESIVGQDYRELVHEVFEVYNNKNLRLIDYVTGFQFFIGYMLGFKIFYFIESGQAGNFLQQSIPGGLVFFFLLVSFVTLPYLTRYTRTLIEPDMKNLVIAILGIVIPSILVFFRSSVFGEQSRIAQLIVKDVVLFDSVLAFVLGAAVLLGLFVLKDWMYKTFSK